MHYHRWIFATTCSYRDFVSFFKQLIVDYSLMHLFLKAFEETLLANWLQVFWSLYKSFSLFTNFTDKFGHLVIIIFMVE